MFYIVYFAGVRPRGWQHYPRLPSCHHRAESFGPDTTLRRGWKLFHHWLRNDTHKECRKVSAVPIIHTTRSNQYRHILWKICGPKVCSQCSSAATYSTLLPKTLKGINHFVSTLCWNWHVGTSFFGGAFRKFADRSRTSR